MKLHSIYDIERELYPFIENGKRLGDKAYKLDEIKVFLNQIGNPQDNLKVVHVAGTSGKTSTCYYLASLLQSAGLKTGLTVSPHILSITERLQINVQPMSIERFCDYLEAFLPKVHKSGLTLTYFLVLVAFVYWTFEQEKVDYAVVETGLGGRLDGTNTVSNPGKICVITDIGFDHMEFLGNTLTAIATEKAGIIHEGNQVYMLEQPPEVLEVFKKRTEQVGAALRVISDEQVAEQASKLGEYFHTLPAFQQRNASLAYAVVAEILKGQTLKQGMSEQAFAVNIPGRMEIHALASGQTLIFDGAHNVQKFSALTAAIRQTFPGQSVAALVGMKNTKDYTSAMEELLPILDAAIATKFEAMQDIPISSTSPQLIADYLIDNGVPTSVLSDYRQAADQLLARPERVLLVTGSLYLLGQVKQYLEQPL